jgi:predicted flap endonuclease-1-like 5' DNA nuclease
MQPPVGENRAYNAARAQPTHMTPAAQKPDSNDNIAARQRDEASETTLPPRPLQITPIRSSSNADTNQDGRTARTYLAPGDDIEAAPSIGPKTAAHLYAVGIKTVAQFLDADPFDLADKLDARYITAETIADWQDQAHLVMAVPGLRGTHAQLLVGAGYRSVAAIAGAAPDELSADILKFAATPDGQRVLREGNPPDTENIKTWVDSACAALAA